jgi:hypothetical protein
VKVYLDDVRPEPEGWLRAYTYEQCVELLETGAVTHLDLDWNLGQGPERTGLSVLEWLEDRVSVGRLRPPALTVHTADPRARREMLAAIERISAWANR